MTLTPQIPEVRPGAPIDDAQWQAVMAASGDSLSASRVLRRGALARLFVVSEGTDTIECSAGGAFTFAVAKAPALAGGMGAYAQGDELIAVANVIGGTLLDQVQWQDINIDARSNV